MSTVGLVVADSAVLTASDTAVRDRLTAAGHTVTLINDEAAEHTGLNLYFICESVAAVNVGAKYMNSTSPVIVNEPGIWGTHAYAPGAGTGTAGRALHHNSTHPIVAGVASGANMYTANHGMNSRPDWAAEGTMIGSYLADLSTFFIWAALGGGTWPARRVCLGFNGGGLAALTVEGGTVFDQAVAWALSTADPAPTPAAGTFSIFVWLSSGWAEALELRLLTKAMDPAPAPDSGGIKYLPQHSNKYYLGGKRPSGANANDGNIYNTPIGANAVFTPANLVRTASSNGRVTGDEIWISYPEDPMGVLRCTVYPIGDYPVRIPQNVDAVHDGSPNGIVAFLTEDNSGYWNGQSMLRTSPTSVAEVEYLWPQTTPTSTDGTDFRGQHGGSHLSGIFGTIRKWEWKEMATNPFVIRHALNLNVWCKRAINGRPQGMTKGNVWPAPDDDAYWGDDGGTNADGTVRKFNANHYGADPSHPNGIGPDMHMGSLLAIPPGTDLSFITDARVLAVANAFKDFGAYIVDDTYWDVTALSVEYDIYSEWMSAGATFHKELQDVILKLAVVKNNTASSIGGGGSWVADPPPPLSDAPLDAEPAPAPEPTPAKGTNLLTPNEATSDTALEWVAKTTNTTVSRSTTVYRTGPASVKLVATAAGSVQATNGWRSIRNVPIQPLIHSIWLRMSGNVPPTPRVLINWINSAGQLISQPISSLTGSYVANSWVEYTLGPVTPPDGSVDAEVVVIFDNLDAGESVHFDDYFFGTTV